MPPARVVGYLLVCRRARPPSFNDYFVCIVQKHLRWWTFRDVLSLCQQLLCWAAAAQFAQVSLSCLFYAAVVVS
jgi:hypothetical protein